MTDRQKERQRLLAQKATLRAKYPGYPHAIPTDEEPEEVLRHCREVIQYKAATENEHSELAVWWM